MSGTRHAEVMEEGGFTIISGRGSRRRPAPPKRVAMHAAAAPSEPLRRDAAGRVAGLMSLGVRVDAAVDELRASALARRLRAVLRGLAHPACERPPVEAIVCLGLGSFGTATAPRYQVALALLLREELLGEADGRAEGTGGDEAETPFCAFDPCFDELEIAFLRSRGCAVLTRNSEGRHSSPAPGGGSVLFFMPHCGRALYSNLVQHNWRPASLASMLVLGNSFAALSGDPGAERAAAWSPLFRALPLASESPIGVPAGSAATSRGGGSGEPLFANAFNNTSLHAFDDDALGALPEGWWERSFEPPPRDGERLMSLDIVPAEA